MSVLPTPLPLFDSETFLETSTITQNLPQAFNKQEVKIAAEFLKAYGNSRGTFNSYRREIERLLQWQTLIQQKPLSTLKREDLTQFIEFCSAPPKNWIGTHKPPRFIEKNGKRESNPVWRPFIATVSKARGRQGAVPSVQKFELSDGSMREVLAILSSFFNYLIQENFMSHNPVQQIRQKNQLIRKKAGQQVIRRLSDLQWQTVMEVVKQLAEKDPNKHERTLFIFSALYGMYLRISELTVNKRWAPKMSDFFRDQDGNWWFQTVGKGNKHRQIAVSESMLAALKRWRTHLNLSALPSPADLTPLLPKQRGVGGISSTNLIREIVQFGFDSAIEKLTADGLGEEASSLHEATVHWLRHTGISDDVKIRPREHVRDDAGHSSGAITDRYIDVELRARHQSAKKKKITESF